jgi:hypothetical protein
MRVMAKLERTEKSMNVIIEELQKGELGLPEIQRGYVWYQTQVRDLVESMYKEYPCGLILLWKPPAEMLDSLKLRNTEIFSQESDSAVKPLFLILDGQQRLTSVLRVLNGRTDVYFNVEEEKFEIKSPKIKNQPNWISVTDLFRNGAIKTWKQLKAKHTEIDEEKSDEYLERLSRLEKIKEYRIPVEILHTDDYEEITEAFIRINSKGTKLREAELALAQLALSLPGLVSNEFEDALEEYESKDFRFEARHLIRCFVAIATGQSRFKHLNKLWESGDDELKRYWRLTKKGLDSTINFLRNNVGIESSDWITSINALVPIVIYFSKKRQLTDAEEKLLLFWYYSASIWGRYSSSAETKLDQDLDVLINKDSLTLKDSGLDSIIKNCRKDVSDLRVDEEELIGTYQRSPFLPLLFAIARKQKAKDWFNAIELSATSVGPSHQVEMHHIFPKSILKKMGYSPKEYDDLANIAFLSQEANLEVRNSAPIDYIKRYGIEKDRSKTQLIPINEDLWEIENFEKFKIERRKIIAASMNEYLTKLGGEYMSI